MNKQRDELLQQMLETELGGGKIYETALQCVVDDDLKKALNEACEAVEDEEDEHLYHSKGWCRELWIASLGMKAVLPPPEERKHVKTAIGASRAEQGRDALVKH